MRHQTVDARGTRIHLVEEGEGPLVLFVHGFPESWYSWRHQLPAMAQAGYRAVAIDVRGYGRSSKPPEIEAYGMVDHVADNVGVVEAMGEETAIVVGHDWGSPIAAASALLRPDVFTGVGLLSVAYSPPGVGVRRKCSPPWHLPATRSFTSIISRNRGEPRPRPSWTFARGCSASMRWLG